jgi:hypothetical protein
LPTTPSITDRNDAAHATVNHRTRTSSFRQPHDTIATATVSNIIARLFIPTVLPSILPPGKRKFLPLSPSAGFTVGFP